MRVEVLDETGRFRRRERLAALLQRLAVAAGLDAPAGGVEREMTVVLVDDEAIARRNATDRGVTGATDVLSYPSGEPDDVGVPVVAHLGDVVVSVETAARQARGRHPVWHEVALLGAHGLLHLHGYDHGDDESWGAFHAVQRLAAAEARTIDLAVGVRRALRGGSS